MTLHEWAPLHDYATDLTIGDRVRSSLGPLLTKLDQPRVHVMSSTGRDASRGRDQRRSPS